jgi:four helix bundle protein
MNDEQSKNDLKVRTRDFALRVIRLCSVLPPNGPGDVVSRQLVRSGTSVGAQYREAHRARSNAEFISKLECVTQELDETIYWLELLVGAKFMTVAKLVPLQREANELMSIFVASIKTAKNNKRR